MTELFVWWACGLILFFSAILVFQECIQYYFLKISFSHPWDYVAHFVTCFVGVIFFFILFQKTGSGFEIPLASSVVIMLIASLSKECLIDSRFSIADMFGNILGIVAASLVLFFVY